MPTAGLDFVFAICNVWLMYTLLFRSTVALYTCCCEQDLVQTAAAAEQKRLREEKRIKRALDDKFPTANDAPDEVYCHGL